MIIASKVRKEARTRLKGNYWKIFLVTLVSIILTVTINIFVNIGNQASGFNTNAGIQFQTWIINIITFFLTAGATATLLYFIRERLEKDFNPFLTIFGFLKAPYFMPFFVTGVLVFIFSTLWAIPFGFGLGLISVGLFVGHDVLVLIGVPVVLVGFALLILKPLRYAFAINATVDLIDENGRLEKPTEAINRSKELIKGHVWDYIRLNLSFIGWGLLAIITLGIGFLFLLPYTRLANMLFYQELIDRK